MARGFLGGRQLVEASKSKMPTYPISWADGCRLGIGLLGKRSSLLFKLSFDLDGPEAEASSEQQFA